MRIVARMAKGTHNTVVLHRSPQPRRSSSHSTASRKEKTAVAHRSVIRPTTTTRKWLSPSQWVGSRRWLVLATKSRSPPTASPCKLRWWTSVTPCMVLIESIPTSSVATTTSLTPHRQCGMHSIWIRMPVRRTSFGQKSK